MNGKINKKRIKIEKKFDRRELMKSLKLVLHTFCLRFGYVSTTFFSGAIQNTNPKCQEVEN